MSDGTMCIAGLFVYPVKSCAGVQLTRGEIGSRGFQNDRRWMLVTDADRFMTQREYPSLALIQPSVDSSGRLCLNAPEMPELTIEPDFGSTGRRLDVAVFATICTAVEESREAAQWLSEFLKRPCKLVRMADDFCRYATSAIVLD